VLPEIFLKFRHLKCRSARIFAAGCVANASDIIFWFKKKKNICKKTANAHLAGRKNPIMRSYVHGMPGLRLTVFSGSENAPKQTSIMVAYPLIS
jgi:hypothetical protein